MPKIACVQCDVAYGEPTKNLAFALAQIQELASQGVQLIVFPEAFLTGYAASSAGDAEDLAIADDHPALTEIDMAAQNHEVTVIVGFAGKDKGHLFNCAWVCIPRLEPVVYRKTHLPVLGFDRFAVPGNSLEVFHTPIGKIGVLICFDLRFPEAARTLALKGAELLVLPTNWPNGAQISADHISIARAAENRMFVATCNRVGEEAGFEFIGRSKIIGIDGEILASADNGETILVADIELSQARNKNRVVVKGEYETDVFQPRQPNLYEGVI